MSLAGIDVSAAQPVTPNLAGLSFLLAKASEGSTYRDPMYATHSANARAAGLIVGAYHFGNPVATPAQQVATFLSAAGPTSWYALDIEGGNMPLPAAADFIRGMHLAGRRCGLYHSLSGYPATLGQDWSWVADWAPAPPAHPWDIWQRRGAPLDLDTYAGDLAGLAALAGEGIIVTYPVPVVPAVGDIARGVVLYTTDGLSDADPKRIIIDPGRTMPYLGQPTTTARLVQYVNAAGVASGLAYYVKAGAITNIRPAAAPVPDCTEAVAAAVAPLNAQIVSLTADVATAAATGARAEYDRQAAWASVAVKLADPRP